MTASSSRVLAVDVWFDVMCPFCLVGLAALDEALAGFEHSQDVRLRHRSYQLLPELPTDAAWSLVEHFRLQHGVDADRAEAMSAQVRELGRSVGLELHPEAVVVTNTRAAHRLVHLARAHGRQPAMVQRLLRGYFAEGRHLGSHEQLAAMAADVGLDVDEARTALASGAYEDDVAADVRTAHEIGVTGVPFVLLDGRLGMIGARSAATYARALATAYAQPPT